MKKLAFLFILALAFLPSCTKTITETVTNTVTVHDTITTDQTIQNVEAKHIKFRDILDLMNKYPTVDGSAFYFGPYQDQDALFSVFMSQSQYAPQCYIFQDNWANFLDFDQIDRTTFFANNTFFGYLSKDDIVQLANEGR